MGRRSTVNIELGKNTELLLKQVEQGQDLDFQGIAQQIYQENYGQRQLSFITMRILNTIGLLLEQQQIDRAGNIDLLMQQLSKFGIEIDKKQAFIWDFNKSVMFRCQGQLDWALSRAKKCEKLTKQNKLKKYRPEVLTNLAAVYRRLGKYQKAQLFNQKSINYLIKVVQQDTQNIQDQLLLVQALHMQGLLYKISKKYITAQENHQKANEILGLTTLGQAHPFLAQWINEALFLSRMPVNYQTSCYKAWFPIITIKFENNRYKSRKLTKQETIKEVASAPKTPIKRRATLTPGRKRSLGQLNKAPQTPIRSRIIIRDNTPSKLPTTKAHSFRKFHRITKQNQTVEQQKAPSSTPLNNLKNYYRKSEVQTKPTVYKVKYYNPYKF